MSMRPSCRSTSPSSLRVGVKGGKGVFLGGEHGPRGHVPTFGWLQAASCSHLAGVSGHKVPGAGPHLSPPAPRCVPPPGPLSLCSLLCPAPAPRTPLPPTQPPGEEENGSTGFHEAVSAHLGWFEGSQIVIISNTLWVGERVPCLTYGMRGMISASIEVHGPARDLHSGNEGGEKSGAGGGHTGHSQA